MTQLRLATPAISLDEPAFLLVEEHIQSPGSKGFHRYQTITIVRNDELVEWCHDMGPASKFLGVDQFRIPGGVQDPTTRKLYIEHTVGELKEIADTLRTRKQMWRQLPRTDLVAAYQRYLEQKAEVERKRMIFGPYQTRGITRIAKESHASQESN